MKTDFRTQRERLLCLIGEPTAANVASNRNHAVERKADANYKRLREMSTDAEEINILEHRALLSRTSQVVVVTDKHEVLITLAIFGVSAAQRREHLIEIAKTVVSRLPTDRRMRA